MIVVGANFQGMVSVYRDGNLQHTVYFIREKEYRFSESLQAENTEALKLAIYLKFLMLLAAQET